MGHLSEKVLPATDGSECAFEFVPAGEYAGVALGPRSPAGFDEQVGRIGGIGAR